MGGGVSLIDGHIDEPKCCENCVYYDTERQDQPCCGCVGGCNYEESKVEGEIDMAYIERETYSKALKDLISDSDGRTNYEKGYIQGLATANGILLDENQTPTADVVEVVRCKDCKHAKLDLMEEGLVVCRRPVLKNGQLLPFNWENKYNDFCSYGERKDEE